jgi:hypothetical protein
MATNNELINNFTSGQYRDLKTDKECNNMKIIDRDGFSIIEGYTHAMYSMKIKEKVIVFDGWYGYSSTTSTHLNKIKRTARKEMGVDLFVSKAKPKSFETNIEAILKESELEEALPQEKYNEITAKAL